jgi:hypothetical protein
VPEVAFAMREALHRHDFRCADVLCEALQSGRTRQTAG